MEPHGECGTARALHAIGSLPDEDAVGAPALWALKLVPHRGSITASALWLEVNLASYDIPSLNEYGK